MNSTLAFAAAFSGSKIKRPIHERWIRYRPHTRYGIRIKGFHFMDERTPISEFVPSYEDWDAEDWQVEDVPNSIAKNPMRRFFVRMSEQALAKLFTSGPGILSVYRDLGESEAVDMAKAKPVGMYLVHEDRSVAVHFHHPDFGVPDVEGNMIPGFTAVWKKSEVS